MTYFVPINPGSAEQSTYNRFSVAFVFNKRSISWSWQFDIAMSSYPMVRMCVDGAPVTDWIAPVGGIYTFSFLVANGHHVAQPEIQGMACCVLPKPFVVNDTPQPLPEQNPWTALNRLETHATPRSIQTDYLPGWRPYAAPLKPRVVVPFSTRLPDSQLWCRRVADHDRATMKPRWQRTPKGDVICVKEQKYSYGSAISLGEFKAGLVPPQTVCRDGPRNWGTLGYVAKLILRRGGKGAYFIETDGRVGFLQFKGFTAPANIQFPAGGPRGADGMISTWAGWHIPEDGMAVFGGGEAGWEIAGDWSRMPQPHRFHECWGLAVALKKPDGTIDNRDGLDMWIADTLNHRIIYGDAWASHPDVSSITGRASSAHFPPVGYSTPGVEARGKMSLVPFAGNSDATPSEFVNEPWSCKVRKQDGKLYWTNFAGDSICRANLDGTGVEKIVGGVPKTDAQLGIPSRLYPSNYALATVRSTHLTDGPASSVSITRPQDFDFDGDGNLIFAERYTYAIRKLDLATMQISTIYQIPAGSMSLTSSSSSTQDVSLCVDELGEFGPAGDIFYSAWAHTNGRISASGQGLGMFAFHSGAYAFRNGPWNLVDCPNYAWPVDVSEGRLVMAGNDSGSQFVEVTKRLPTDPAPNEGAFARGFATYNQYLRETQGAFGYNEVGFANVEQLAALSDSALAQEFLAAGIPSSAHADLIYWMRFTCADYDLTQQPAIDTDPPAAPSHDLIVTIGD